MANKKRNIRNIIAQAYGTGQINVSNYYIIFLRLISILIELLHSSHGLMQYLFHSNFFPYEPDLFIANCYRDFWHIIVKYFIIIIIINTQKRVYRVYDVY